MVSILNHDAGKPGCWSIIFAGKLGWALYNAGLPACRYCRFTGGHTTPIKTGLVIVVIPEFFTVTVAVKVNVTNTFKACNFNVKDQNTTIA